MIQNMRNIYQHCSSLQTAWSLAADSYGVSQCSESFWEGSCLPLNALPAGYFTRACSSVQPIEISIDVQLWEPSIHISHWRHAGPWIGTVKRDSSMHVSSGKASLVMILPQPLASRRNNRRAREGREWKKALLAISIFCSYVRTRVLLYEVLRYVEEIGVVSDFWEAKIHVQAASSLFEVIVLDR